MPPSISDRYEFHVRLGRDEDVEEWLATDTTLDRPVVIRFLPPDAVAARHAEFMASVQAAAQVNHTHVSRVFAAGRVASGSYAVIEWTGGASIGDRLGAAEPFPVDEFLPNAAGLASGLATLHDMGAVHGSIDAEAIKFSAAHPAKLGCIGRKSRGPRRQERDVADLARTLRLSVTGSEAGPAPSQVAGGLGPEVDAALDDAEAGLIDAAELAAALRGAPTPTHREERPAWSWRWLIAAGGLLVAALLIAGAGLAIEFDPDSPLLFPATPVQPAPSTTSTTPIDLAPPPTDIPSSSTETALGYSVQVYDPFGEGTERDRELPNLSDGDPATSWRTERYFDPLSRIKPGVGLVFGVAEDPERVIALLSLGTEYVIAWSPTVAGDLSGWDQVTSGTVLGDQINSDLPERDGGFWLLWLTELPSQEGGEFFYSFINEVRFLRG